MEIDDKIYLTCSGFQSRFFHIH